MGEIPKQLLAWIAKLLPRQQNEGAGSVQIGKAGGNVTTTSNVTNVYVISSRQDSRSASTTDEQREVLGMIRRLPNGDAVFLFMEREFQTRMVIDLSPRELLRVRKYVETINRNAKREKA